MLPTFLRLRSVQYIEKTTPSCIRMVSYRNLVGKKKGNTTDVIEDMFTSKVIDEVSWDAYLKPEKKGILDSLTDKYTNWMSEFNIKRKMKNYKLADVIKELPIKLELLQAAFAQDEVGNSSSLIIPPLMKDIKDCHPLVFPIRQLQSFSKDLRFVGYTMSYLDDAPVLLQTRILKKKDVMFAQMTFGLHTIEDIYGWNNRGKKVRLNSEFPMDLPVVCGRELPLESRHSEWKEAEDSDHHKYYYNPISKESLWTNPDEYENRRRLRTHLCVFERPLFSTIGSWRFHKV